MAISTLPIGFILVDEFLNPSSVIYSGTSFMYPSFKSPVFNHGIFPPKYSGCCRDGVAPEHHSPSSPSRTHSQLSGMSKGFSSSVIAGRGLDFLIFFSLMSLVLSAWISASRSLAVPSSLCCGTSLPSMAYWSRLFFISSGKRCSMTCSLVWALS